jgi:large subunit ribosomal protein L17
MITLGKRGDLHARRMAAAYLMDKEVVSHLFSEVAPRFSKKKGGYTRLLKTRIRHGDGAPMVIVELTETKAEIKKEPTPRKKEKAAKGKEAPEAETTAPAT